MKSKLTEIIESGIAPGISTGAPLKDPSSVYVKAPRGLAAVENEPLFKHGPTRGASRIAKHFGMPTSFIKSVWAKAPLIALMFVALSVHAGDLTTGVSFTDGQTVSASQMNQIVNNATVNNSLISGKPVDSTPLGSDTLLIFSPTLNGLYRLTLNSGVLQNPALITAQTEKTTPVSGDYLLLWDSVGLTLQKVSAGNLALNNTNVVFGAPFIQDTNVDPQVRLPISNYGTNGVTTSSNLFRVFFPNVVTNLPTITAATNTDLVPIYSTRTGNSQTNAMSLISPQALGPSTFVITNISMTNNMTLGLNIGALSTNIPGPLPPLVSAVLLVTNTIIDGAGHTLYPIGTELPSEHVLNAGGLPVVNAFWTSFNSNVLVSTVFATNGLLSIPWLVGTNANTYETASWTNFNIKLYITPRHGL
jgi:hypothetical protein